MTFAAPREQRLAIRFEIDMDRAARLQRRSRPKPAPQQPAMQHWRGGIIFEDIRFEPQEHRTPSPRDALQGGEQQRIHRLIAAKQRAAWHLGHTHTIPATKEHLPPGNKTERRIVGVSHCHP
jgi:hypothetical protein